MSHVISMQLVTKKFYTALTSLPSIALGIYLVFVVKAYFTVGLFPRINVPDPRTVGLYTFGLFIFIGLLMSIVSTIPWISVTIFSWYKKSFTEKFLIVSGVVYIVSFVIFLVLLRLDFGGFLFWLNGD